MEPSHRTYLTDIERENLLKRLDAHGVTASDAGRAAENRRKHRRWEYRQSDIAVTVEHPAGGVSRLLVCARNISSRGMAFIHAGFIYKGSNCRLLLQQTDGEAIAIAGVVTSCRHIDGMLHEIGVRFERQIDVTHFVSGAESRQGESASLRLSEIHGRVLYVDDSVDDRDLMKFMLQACGAEVCVAAGGEEAISLAGQSPFAAILTELRLSGVSGTELVKTLRSNGYTGPILGVTADERPETADAARAAGCTGVLIKPLELEQVTQALGQQSATDSVKNEGVEPLFSSLWNETDMRPLITAFVKRLEEHVQHLHQGVAAKDWPSVEKLCFLLKGSAGGYGYSVISEVAAAILKLGETQAASPECSDLVRQLEKMSGAAQTAIGTAAATKTASQEPRKVAA